MGPYAYARYACAPPFTGIDEPSCDAGQRVKTPKVSLRCTSAKLDAPVHPSSPATSQTPKLAPTLFAFATTTPGDELAGL
jgi:hypothetical protein